MDDLEVCRLSAEALGKVIETDAAPKDAVWVQGPNGERWVYWNPLTNAEQRWECVERLLERGSIVLSRTIGHGVYSGGQLFPEITCPAAEFPARAVAEIRRRDGS